VSDAGLISGLSTPVDFVGQLTPALSAAAAGAGGDAKSIEKVAHDFESVLLQKVFDEMRKTVPESGLLESAEGEQIQGLFWTFMAQDVADHGGIGLWKELARQISRTKAEADAKSDAPPLVGPSQELVIPKERSESKNLAAIEAYGAAAAPGSAADEEKP
jgi:peptidoglycan hydrolase FlgJ